MKRHRSELESTLLAIVAATPLYLTSPISVFATFFFHVVMGAIAIAFLAGRPLRLSPILMGFLGLTYLLFFPIDAMMISRSLIRASTHLLFFIAVYQGFESASSDNQTQRLLVTFLIFVTSLASSTHLSIVLFVLIFAVLAFRELMTISWKRTAAITGSSYHIHRRGRPALLYVIPTLLAAIVFFPILPRLRNPFVQGPTSMLSDSTTGITESINLEEAQYGSSDPGVVARIWMGVDALPFFTPIRLKAAVYNQYTDGEWESSEGLRGPVWRENDQWVLSRPEGITTTMEVQQQPTRDRQLFFPVGTHSISGVSPLYWGDGLDRVVTPAASRNVTFTAGVSQRTIPFEAEILPSGYPMTDDLRALATEVVGGAATPAEKAAKIETWMTTEFSYLANTIDRDPMTLEEFLFRRREGHCEFFAAGMVVLLGAVDVPARIVGGFYGGQLNPLGRYFVLRRSDAHAWVEVYDGRRWITYDPTPPGLRPGASSKSAILQYLSAIQDSIIYFWDRWVLTYGLSDQMELALELFQRLRDTIAEMGAVIRTGQPPRVPRWIFVLMGTLIPAVIVAQLIRARRRSMFEQLAEHLGRLGYPIDESWTAGEILGRLREKNAGIATLVAPVVRYHELQRFSGREPDAELRSAAATALKQLAQER